jgi:ATP-dependent RNA helicase HelY
VGERGFALGAFQLDAFQLDAIAAIDRGENVLVAAPTGAGKTVVAEHAVARALATGRRAFYTTPIKALSNQKYGDLVRRHGADRVGILTGDNAVNPDAPVVVMTTEVLRNMVYAGSPALRDLAWVVLDEVHYLQDTYRGPVWEEVIIHTPPAVRFVCLSATVSNAEELAGWIASGRGATATVIEHERPVELVNHYLVADRGAGDLVRLPTLVDGRPNLEGGRFDVAAPTGPRHLRHRDRSRQRWSTPRRPEVVEHLAGSSLLPAIYFIFSRAACDDAVRAVLESGLRLTRPAEARRVQEIVAAHVDHLDPGDLALLDHDRWRAGLEAGVAAHHAGMVPPFKEAVESCFAEGLVKVVFATETLALGINMPARSVVIESLSKFTGDHHEDLTPSQYTQLTGRAGRRGLDPVGHAIVLWSPWSGFDKVAALASSREFLLRSAFKPTYNMVVNLVRRHDRDQAHELLGRSFAQYQADRSIARLTNRRARRAALLVESEAAATCELGDVGEYRARRRAEREAFRRDRAAVADRIGAALADLVPGDVLRLRGHRLAVLSVSHRKGGLRVRVIDTDARVEILGEDDFDGPPPAQAALRLPEPFDPRDRAVQRQLTAQLRKVRLRHGDAGPDPSGGGGPDGRAADLAVAACPDLQAHLAAAAERDRLLAQIADDDRRLAERTGSLIRQFDQIHHLLERWRVVDGWSLTPTGTILSRLFHEADLLCALAIADGLLDDLTAPELAGVASSFTYEHRSKELAPPPWFPTARMRERAARIEALARRLVDDEHHLGLPGTRPPDPTIAALAHAWAAGDPLDEVLGEELLSGGDFVRNIKTLIDLLRQVATVAPDRRTAAVAAEAADSLLRGVVAASSEIVVPGPTAAG